MNKETFKNTQLIEASLKKRYAREKRFQWYGRLAVLMGFAFLFILLFDIVSKGTPAFTQKYLLVPVPQFSSLLEDSSHVITSSPLPAQWKTQELSSHIFFRCLYSFT